MSKELEALGLLASRVQVGAYKEEMQKCFDIVKEALKRNESMKVDLETILHLSYAHFYDCPKCGNTVRDTIDRKYYNYCPFCGQKLDWSDEK